MNNISSEKVFMIFFYIYKSSECPFVIVLTPVMQTFISSHIQMLCVYVVRKGIKQMFDQMFHKKSCLLFIYSCI